MVAAPWMDFLDQNFKFSTLRLNFPSTLISPLQKCCSYDELFSYIDERCIPLELSSTFSHTKQDPRPNSSEFKILVGLKCFSSNKPLTYSYLRDSARIVNFFGNGSLNVQFGRMREPKHFELGEYCIETEKEMLNPMLFTCQTIKADGYEWFAFIFFVSLLLWMITFSLHLTMPELHKRVYDKCFVSFMGFGILALLLILLRRAVDDLRHLGIKTRFITLMCIHYVLMVSYCWLHVTCIHIWRTVTTTKAISGRSFYAYILYALGLPVVSGIVLSADLYISGWETFLHRYFRHGLSSNPVLLYFIHVCAILQVINLFLFMHVGYLIWYQKKAWSEDSANGYQRHVSGQQKTVISRIIRLSVLMGLDWLNIFLLNYVNCRSNMSNIFYLIYHINLCPGYVIFITFVCYNDQVIYPIKQKYPKIIKVGSSVIKILFGSVLAIFVYFVIYRWGKVGQNILRL